MAGVVSVEEFGALQNQLMKLKEEKYDAIEREKKLKKEVERLSKLQTESEAQIKKQAEPLSKSKDAGKPPAASPDVEASRRAMEQLKGDHKLQLEMIKQNLNDLSEENSRLRKELDSARKPAPPAAPASSSTSGAASASNGLPGQDTTNDRPHFDREALISKLAAVSPPDGPDPEAPRKCAAIVEQLWAEQMAAVTAKFQAEVGQAAAVLAGLRAHLQEATARKAEVEALLATAKTDADSQAAAAKLELAEARAARARLEERIAREAEEAKALTADLTKEVSKQREALSAREGQLASLKAEQEGLQAQLQQQLKEAEARAAELAALKAASAKRAAELEAQLAEGAEKVVTLTRERDGLRTDLEQLNAQVQAFTTSREEFITELKKGRDMLEEALQKKGALLAAVEGRLKDATEHAAQQAEKLEKALADLAVANEDLARHRTALEQFQQADKESNDRIVQLEAALAAATEEAAMASKIAEKKTARQVKDLQEQLQRERALRGGDKSKPLDASSAAASPTAASASKKPAPSEPTREELMKETNILAMRLGDLQTEKSALEERNRHLAESLKFLNTEVEKKDALIKHGLMSLRIGGPTGGRTTPAMDKQKLQTGGAFNKRPGHEVGNEKEIYAKMESVAEETILKNLQLMNDIKVLGDEVTRLAEENKKLKAAAPPAVAGTGPPPATVAAAPANH